MKRTGVGCCLYSKGKNFRANHNRLAILHNFVIAVVYIAKVRILEQITTILFASIPEMSCCLYSKGKNFRANHNEDPVFNLRSNAVVYIAKVRILEQITTNAMKYGDRKALLFI